MYQCLQGIFGFTNYNHNQEARENEWYRI